MTVSPEKVGFLGIQRTGPVLTKLQLLPAYPADDLPPACASLLGVASKRGLIAAAGPNCLVVTSTHTTRQAFEGETDPGGVVTKYSPDITINVPQLRHLAFSSGEDFLVTSAEAEGGLVIYDMEGLCQEKHDPMRRISTGNLAVKALIPNPDPKIEHYFAAVLDSGKLVLSDVDQGSALNIRSEKTTCAAWSTEGTALVAGLNDGTAVLYMPDGNQIGSIPRPPKVAETLSVSAIHWLSTYEFFIVHSPENMPPGGDSIYHYAKSDERRSTYTFSPLDGDICWPSGPERIGLPRVSITRLQGWKPDIDDMLIVSTSSSSDIAMILNTSAPVAAEQENTEDYVWAILPDNRQAIVPCLLGTQDESSLIGVALDLSSKVRIPRPIQAMAGEIDESPTPLPAFLALNFQGILCVWWIIWDNSIIEGVGYPGLIELQKDNKSATPAAIASPTTQTPAFFTQPTSTTSVISKPADKPALFGDRRSASSQATATQSTFGLPSVTAKSAQPTFGATGFAKPTFGDASAIGGSGKPGFAQPTFGTTGFAKPTFGDASAIGGSGKPGFAQPTFGATGFAKPTFGDASAIGGSGKPGFAQPTFGATGFAKPTFGDASAIGGSGKSGFGVTGGMGQTQSQWGTGASTSSQTQPNPFSAPQAKDNPFAKAAGGLSGFAAIGQTTTSTGSAFSSFNSGVSSPSPFSNLGQQKSIFMGTTTQPSFGTGSTVTIGGTSSFGSATSANESGMSDARNRERDEATPTPQTPSIFGEKFTLGTTFKGDGSAKDDLPKPAAATGGSLLGDLQSTLTASTSRNPATPIKQEEQEIRLQDISTTPSSPPKAAQALFSSSTTPKGTQAKKQLPIVEDAPLPPDPMTWKPRQTNDEDLPPIVGSPGIEVEAPDSSAPSSPLDDDDDFESDSGSENEVQEPFPSDRANKARTPQARFNFQHSVPPQAPTPPVRTTSPSVPQRYAQPSKSVFNQFSAPKPTSTTSMFEKPNSLNSTQKQSPYFPPVSVQNQNQPSTSGIRQKQAKAPSPSLRQSLQEQSKPPTPEPEVSDLSDDNDERIRTELAREVEPRRTLDPFIAHQDYTGSSLTKTGHAAQIEIIYRDINSMVDTLGLNSRSLAAFVRYHNNGRQSNLTRSGLEEIEDQGEEGPWFDEWRISEISDLAELEAELEDELDQGRVQDVVDKLGQLGRLLRDKAKLMTKINDIRRQIINRKDPEKAEALRKASLPKELAEQQKALRNEYARQLSLLSQTEEATMLLRSKLASHSAENGKPGAMPTVDAVKKTIIKMISLTEKKNSEIVLLESQLRKIGLGDDSRLASSSSRILGTPSRSSRALRGQSPFATPPTNKSTRMSLSELNRKAMTPEMDETTPSRGYGLFYTPEGSPTPGDSLVRLANKMDDNALVGLRETAARRKKLAQGLANAVLKRGVKVTRIE
ncbi:hypothetical protein K504DRAFT_504544 [Pleomassaria siparia CBS 279.74]|uniref:Nucleoporin Nup159/Nup146 N-terminal domain-containing protein n=1 Tax=Pleomassaria siparia CBS 279.74 TaxID=1314801 RepID=A0A6G1K3D9_9PLEO|nr:hypothetical protein K504DRAFT_504544 [Pleomassaria siparia CBS 279.74]